MMTVLTLHRTDPTKNLHRYYRLDVQRDLFGEWCVILEWGRIQSKDWTKAPSLVIRGRLDRAVRGVRSQVSDNCYRKTAD
jgi:hypothetical protein